MVILRALPTIKKNDEKCPKIGQKSWKIGQKNGKILKIYIIKIAYSKK